ncbi:Cof-type HAD-IIB family hydrolase [Acerihabitans arboris]|uniref:Cof-type HAD-IIB family hydrolase n=1 Tax=Acerihabitans arboris TaxID=2691583 RepID=A0A845SBB9_9GAMM|nr:Cof-type HAD-IIB family hydrolase [Acerihabitans arboris]NDL62123.1 Cof-type HAD-IIB family hydrolase [Acerihabitans arboris]
MSSSHGIAAAVDYRLVIFDLDGTILTPEKKLTPRFKRAVKHAVRLGVVIALASGRSLDSVLDVLRQLPLGDTPGYAIACNGALVWSRRPGRYVAKECLEICDALALSELGRRLGYACYMLENNHLLTDFPIAPDAGGYLFSRLAVARLPDDWWVTPRRPPKMMFIEQKEKIDALPALIPPDIAGRYHFVRSEPNYYEVMKKGVHKGSACRTLAAYLGIPMAQVIAVGDEQNDKEMLLFAGVGVAMGNAAREIKSLADWVTDSNENEGAAKVLEHFIIKKR